MPSEQRLHPVSIFFALKDNLKAFALPLLLVLLSGLRSALFGGGGEPDPEPQPGLFDRWTFGSDAEGWQIWLTLFLLAGVVSAVLRYLTFRLTYEGTELVIRSGLFFRNERHVPYDRIQNLDATRSLLHRAFGVAEVRVETGGGLEPEARISVLREAEFEEMRRRVFEGRTRAGAADAGATEAGATEAGATEADAVAGTAAGTAVGAVPAGTRGLARDGTPQPPVSHTLLHLPLRELLLLGLLDNRGFLLIAAAYGLLWESGLQGVLWEGLSSSLSAPGAVSSIRESLRAGQAPSFALVAWMAGGLVGLVLGVRILSMVWVGVTLNDFRLWRAGEDLRTEYGLFTRVTATIPRRRVQSLTVRETPLHRWLGRSSVLVQTAGGTAGPVQTASKTRERLAPIIHSARVPDLISHVMPDANLASLNWQPLHPRAFRRAMKPMLALYFGYAPALLVIAGVHHWWALLICVAIGAVTVLAITRWRVRSTAWALDDHVVAVRSGWLWRSVTVAPVAKVQTVTATESPFDRRARMAAVSVDTAGGVMNMPRLRIPYLARETALELAASLSSRAAQTTFRW